MKGKASDICPKCKHCEGMVADSFYVCGDSHSDGGLYHLMGAEDELYCTDYEEETTMNKVEGKVGYFCLKCKNCKGITKEYDGKNASIRITEVECEDPYDGMVKTLNVYSDICCSTFEPSFNLNMPSRIISEEKYNELKKSRDSWRERYYEVRYALRKDEQLDESISCVHDIPSDVEMIEDLKKRAADSDYYKEMSELLEERNNNQFDIIREKDKKIEDLKIYANENKSMYEDLKYWRERCHKAETGVTILNSKVETLKNKEELTRRYNMIAKKLNDIHDILKEDPNNA